MSWRVVVINSHCKLDLQMNNMVIRKGPEEVIAVYLNELAVVVIENTGVSITAALLSTLSQRKIRVVFCDEKHNPISELHPYYGAHDSNKKLRNQLSWTDANKSKVWNLIAKEKIKNQSLVLSQFGFEKEAKKLLEYSKNVQEADITNREGHAARTYFSALFGNEFYRDKDCYENAALNYGYSIILSAINREIVASGYFTQIGIFHDSVHNHFNLGCDLQEVFRPVVDRKVKSMNPKTFGPKEKEQLLSIVEESYTISDKNQILLNAIGIYVRSVLDVVNGFATEILFPQI